MLYLELLGQIRVSFGPGRQRLHLCRQSAAILANFALAGVRCQAREVLIERFWPDCDPMRGHSNLSTALWRLRRALAPVGDSILADRRPDEAGIVEEALLWIDAEAFRTRVRLACAGNEPLHPDAAADLESALDLYRGDLLEGIYHD